LECAGRSLLDEEEAAVELLHARSVGEWHSDELGGT